MGDKGSYFEDKKKGEMNELRNKLNTIINENDLENGRTVVRKIIGAMTLGMDASPVFPEMCRASYMNDEVIKKMIFFYLTTYAEDNPDLAIMAVNTFKKDCQHTSPNIRGLALRHLCSFKSSDYVNNVLPIARDLLTDHQPYVRKTAIMGLLKVFYAQPTTIIQDGALIDTLSSMIKDSDALVSATAVLTLEQILVSQGGIPLNNRLFFYLLKRLKSYSSFHQSSLLAILYRYTPETEIEHQEVLNVLWEKLRQSSTSQALACIRIMVRLAKDREELFKTVVERSKPTLITRLSSNISSGDFELAYAVLQHIEYIIVSMNGKNIYSAEFKYFYCLDDQPTYIKILKVKILGLLANEYNLGDLLNEMNEYANCQSNELLARHAVKTLTNIAFRLPQVSKALLVNIQAFYRSAQKHLINQAMLSYSYILRKDPKLFSEVSSTLLEHKEYITQTASINAFISIIGSFSQHIPHSPYILQDYLANFKTLDLSTRQILLTQIVNTFLKRPGECYQMLCMVFKTVFSGDSPLELQDHAAFFYRALKDNAEEVRKGFAAIAQDMQRMQDIQYETIVQDDFNTIFNSMGVIYNQKESKFIRNYEYFVSMRNKELGLVSQQEKEQQEEQQEEAIVLEHTDFEMEYALTWGEFEVGWAALQKSVNVEIETMNQELLTQQTMEELFKSWGIMSIACAEEENTLQFYMYCKLVRNTIMIMEVHVEKVCKNIKILAKAEKHNLAQALIQYIREFLKINQFTQ